MKKITASFLIAVSVFLTGGAAYAQNIDMVNDDSAASITSRWLVRVNMNNANSAVIVNNLAATSNSGGNLMVSSDDMTNVSLVTGDATATVLADNAANRNEVAESLESSNGTDASITNVNDESAAEIATTDRLINNVSNLNEAFVENAGAAVSQTGGNVFDSGDSLTGAAMATGLTSALVGVSNMFNLNVKQIVRTIRPGLAF